MYNKNYSIYQNVPEQLELPLFYTSQESPQKSYTEMPTSNVTSEEFERKLEKALENLPERIDKINGERFLSWDILHTRCGSIIDQAA